jgi:hypothetical protein
MPNDGLQWISDLGKMSGVQTPKVDARISGGPTIAAGPASHPAVANPANAKPASAKPAGKGKTPAADAGGPLVIDLDKVGGRMVKVHTDPDDPDSPEIETAEIPVPPPPMPTTLPSRPITIQFLQKLPDHAGQMAGKYGTSIFSACHAFEGYAINKVDALAEDEHLDPSAMVGFLLTGALTLVGGNIAAKLTEKAASEVAKRISEACVDAVKDGLVDATKEAAKPESDLEKRKAAMRTAIQKISQKAQDLQTIMQDKVDRITKDFANHLINRLSDPRTNLSDDEAKNVYPYVSADTDALDRMCEALGVPGGSSRKEINIKFYGELVRQFEIKLQLTEKVRPYLELNSGAILQERSDEAVAEAKKNAVAATKARRAELDKMDAESQ